MVYGLGFRVKRIGCRVQGLGFRDMSLGFRVSFRVYGLGLRV